MSRAKIGVVVAIVVAVAAAAGVGAALLVPAKDPPPPLLSDQECLEAASTLGLASLEFFEVDPNDPRLEARRGEIRADFKRVLSIELSDADLERMRTETLAAWLRRKEAARLQISRYLSKPTPARLERLKADSAKLLREFGDQDFRDAARITKEQYDRLQADVKRRR